ncbi:hypothetical protein AMK26_20010 [Streptomyces sp. CB03234]|nr:hypothetical protein AMK26_20010 [Streptomyces sp. CB03234]
MFWYDHNMNGWGWFAMSISMVLFWALIITATVLLFRVLNRPHEHTHVPAPPTPVQILRDRLARGEVDEDEYRRLMTELNAGPPHQP